MVWASIHGSHKGPFLFWEKDWGTITAQSYSERVVPLIHGYIRMNPHLQLMQDGAPGHSAKQAIEELESRGIKLISWPPYSPDLNPIETVWNRIKDYIQAHSDPDSNLPYERLRMLAREAWDSITHEDISSILSEMPARCKAVVDANGYYTKY